MSLPLSYSNSQLCFSVVLMSSLFYLLYHLSSGNFARVCMGQINMFSSIHNLCLIYLKCSYFERVILQFSWRFTNKICLSILGTCWNHWDVLSKIEKALMNFSTNCILIWPNHHNAIVQKTSILFAFSQNIWFLYTFSSSVVSLATVGCDLFVWCRKYC